MLSNQPSNIHLEELPDGLQEEFQAGKVYHSSVQVIDSCIFFLVKQNSGKKKLVIKGKSVDDLPQGFVGERITTNGTVCLLCPLSSDNAVALQNYLPFTKPQLLGSDGSFGYGDRLGIATPAHIRNAKNSEFRPVFAQQSIREMERTGRTPREVIDAAVWSVFQEGYINGFGADADHLKTSGHIDRTIEAGFTMFTIDPSDHVNDDAALLSMEQLKHEVNNLPWLVLGDRASSFIRRFADKSFRLSQNITIIPTKEAVTRAAIKYVKVIAHTQHLYQYLKSNYFNLPSEVELSVDESRYTTTPVEHLIIAKELQRLNIEIVSLAPRFCGAFEKGIDFRGDIEQFKREYMIHQAIATAHGGYKISIHSGSDKFTVYDAIGEMDIGHVHIKTAGTSYLEALRALSVSEPALFREILDFSITRFEEDRKTYHISTDLEQLPTQKDLGDSGLPELLNDNHIRQVLHVTYGSVLSEKNRDGTFQYKKRMLRALEKNENVHFDCLIRHFQRHVQPFKSMK